MTGTTLDGKRLSEIDVGELERPVLVICHFDDLLGPVPQNPAVHFQVTLNPAAVSPGGEFIAFDAAAGDQVHGWMRMDRILVDEVLRVGQGTAGKAAREATEECQAQTTPPA